MKKGMLIFLFLFVGLFLIYEVSAEAYTCTDSDNGKNYALKGEITETNAPDWDLTLGLAKDTCTIKESEGSYSHVNSCDGEKCFLIEYFCDITTGPNREIVLCNLGCSNGVCIKETGEEALEEGEKEPTEEAENKPESKREIPLNWDWRNVHGENWVVPLRSDETSFVGACAEFVFTSAFESQINLFYNQHLNVDLSEQMKVDCKIGTGPLNLHSNDTLVDENCSPFVNRDIFCNGEYQSTQEEKCCDTPYLCDDWENRTWKSKGLYECGFPPWATEEKCLNIESLDSEEEIRRGEDKIKELLISKGPLKVHLPDISHSELLIGYKKERSDWKTIQRCDFDEICVSDRGCIPHECNIGEPEFEVITYDPVISYTMKVLYACEEYENSGIYFWTLKDREQISSEESLPQKTCKAFGWDSRSRPFAYVEYLPGEGDAIWIFKDYYWIDYRPADIREFGIFIVPSGPFVPPQSNLYWPRGFDNQIKCFDKDNDGFCNWGISDIGKNELWRIKNCPSSCSGNSEKDCDDSDSTRDFFNSCLINNPFSEPLFQQEEVEFQEVRRDCGNGCELNGICYPFGHRKSEKYCFETGEFVPQISEGTCENSFECRSNLCVDDECTSPGLLKQIIDWFRKLFGVK